jgi:hypothetical protein
MLFGFHAGGHLQAISACNALHTLAVSLGEGEDESPPPTPVLLMLIVTGAYPGDGKTTVALLRTTISLSFRTSLGLREQGRLAETQVSTMSIFREHYI